MIKLIQGDCLERMQEIEDGSMDLILCDLPYGTTACKWDNVIPFDPLWEQYNRLIKPEGIVCLFGSQPFTTKLINSNIENFKYEYIWIKNNCSNFQLAKKNPLKFHENICVFYKDIQNTVFSDIIKEQMKLNKLSFSEVSELFLSKNGKKTGWLSNKIKGYQIPTRKQWGALCDLFKIKDEYDYLLTQVKRHKFNPQTNTTNNIVSNKGKSGKLNHLCTKTDSYLQTEKDYPKSILYFKREEGVIHPTQKPVELLEFLIKTYINKGDTVLDNCMGSGSTGIACINTGRNFIGIELDEKYYNISKERIIRHREDVFFNG